MPIFNSLIRFNKLVWAGLRYLANRQVISHKHPWLRFLTYFNLLSYGYNKSPGEALRLTFESLGPIFVKFGQLLSIRGEMFHPEIIAELEKLQDRVPPFPTEQAIGIIERSLNASVDDYFDDFDSVVLGSASVAQVHSARLKNGDEVVVKIIRPNMRKTLRQDFALLYTLARLIKHIVPGGKRLHAKELVQELEYTIKQELNLQNEAASASQLKLNFTESKLLYVPKIYWDYTRKHVMVMERIHGIRISDIAALKAQQVNLEALAKNGVEIFFTQLLRDRFFHADMHPGNLFIDATEPHNPVYMAVDFGIMGTLSQQDQRYIGENFLAIFNRDYQRITELHIESGWVPADTRAEQFTAAVRAVCEPIYEKPISEISFGKLLLSLINVARDFKMPIQPQLMLLQKTLVGIESLGKRLYPELNLWTTAKPFLEKWYREQKNPKRILNLVCHDWQNQLTKLINLPNQLDRVLQPSKPAKTPAPQHTVWMKISGVFIAATFIQAATHYTHTIALTSMAGLITLLIAIVRA